MYEEVEMYQMEMSDHEKKIVELVRDFRKEWENNSKTDMSEFLEAIFKHSKDIDILQEKIDKMDIKHYKDLINEKIKDNSGMYDDCEK